MQLQYKNKWVLLYVFRWVGGNPSFCLSPPKRPICHKSAHSIHSPSCKERKEIKEEEKLLFIWRKKVGQISQLSLLLLSKLIAFPRATSKESVNTPNRKQQVVYFLFQLQFTICTVFWGFFAYILFMRVQ